MTKRIFSHAQKAQTSRMVNILTTLATVHTNEFEGLDYTSVLELLIATILAAQCTDARVNIVTKALFLKYRTVHDYVSVSLEELENDIRPTGFYKNKAKNIQQCCRTLIEQYGSTVPSSREDLITLAGVGRKTANVVLSHCFNQSAITVDTHVTRLSNLLGFVATTNAEKIEEELSKITPVDLWNEINRLFITHGRVVCVARRPRCGECVINTLCPSSLV